MGGNTIDNVTLQKSPLEPTGDEKDEVRAYLTSRATYTKKKSFVDFHVAK